MFPLIRCDRAHECLDVFHQYLFVSPRSYVTVCVTCRESGLWAEYMMKVHYMYSSTVVWFVFQCFHFMLFYISAPPHFRQEVLYFLMHYIYFNSSCDFMWRKHMMCLLNTTHYWRFPTFLSFVSSVETNTPVSSFEAELRSHKDHVSTGFKSFAKMLNLKIRSRAGKMTDKELWLDNRGRRSVW